MCNGCEKGTQKVCYGCEKGKGGKECAKGKGSVTVVQMMCNGSAEANECAKGVQRVKCV